MNPLDIRPEQFDGIDRICLTIQNQVGKVEINALIVQPHILNGADERDRRLLTGFVPEILAVALAIFRYETGQETPITLVRAIQDVGLDNQGVNFDLANLILYGKANPVDAIELLGPYVQGIHAKDGLWPTNPRE